MLQETTQYIENQTDLVIGTDLFCGWRPETAPDECVTVMEPTGPQENFYITGQVSKPVQILARSENYDQAMRGVKVITALFCGQARAGLSLPTVTSGESYLVHTAQIISGPAYLGQDERGLHEAVANILLITQLN